MRRCGGVRALDRLSDAALRDLALQHEAQDDDWHEYPQGPDAIGRMSSVLPVDPSLNLAPLHRTRIRTMSDPMTVTDAKARLSELVAAVAATQDHVEITRNGKPAAVLVSHAEIAALRDTIAILSDPQAAEDIRQAEDYVLAARTVNAEELRVSMLKRRPATA